MRSHEADTIPPPGLAQEYQFASPVLIKTLELRCEGSIQQSACALSSTLINLKQQFRCLQINKKVTITQARDEI